MSRYIKLYDLIDGNYTNVCPSIMKLPSIDIVLCKECILFADRRGDSWWDSDSDGYCRRISRFGDCKEVYVDDFCSYGEAKEK